MSQENVETIRRANEALKRGDRDSALADYHPDVEWIDLAHAPDSPERGRGLSAVHTIWDQWEEAFDDFGADIEEFIDAGRYVLAVTRWYARGKGSGIVTDVRQVDVFEVENGKVVRAALAYPDAQTALEAFGLVKEPLLQAKVDPRAYAGAMADDDVTFATLDYEQAERFQTLRRELGVGAFGINLLLFAPGERGRIHAHDRQEEVYLVLAGELTLVVERVEHVLDAKRAVRVAPGVRRQLVNAGPERLVLLALGGAGEHVGRDGRAWEAWDEGGPGRAPQEIALPENLPQS